jgi:GMP synthase-like glutamine amidotransferase
MANICVLKHFWCEGPGAFDDALRQAGHRLVTVNLYEGESVPQAGDYDAWLIMGGPMNVDEVDQHPYLLPERRLIAELIRRDRPMLGICLGAQLIARAAGARVYARRPKEIGLFQVELTADAVDDPLFGGLPSPLEVFQWHGDTFDLPADAVWLARSARYEHQAFRLGRRVYALQFHLEVTPATADQWYRDWEQELAELPAGERRPAAAELAASLDRQIGLAYKLVERWVGLFDGS